MEVDLVTSGVRDEDTFEVNDGYVEDGSAFEGERCGICMDIIIDRGVLDCCQHWFCFVCIDNWATITNLCPLCQNEFQMITCVPVYDTIGSNKVDEDSIARDDDWCIEGKNNTLSFPSYYIDENAVICLDGDGCKIRNGPANNEEDSNLDTSIACDSCDIWYHAFCVGFDTECTSESTWLCPRCVADKLPEKSDTVLMQSSNSQNGMENVKNERLLQTALSGKVSVSVADAGETAVVVSVVGGNQFTEEPSEDFLSNLEVDKHLKTETLSSSVANGYNEEIPLKDRTGIKSTLEARELQLSLSCDTSLSFPPPSLELGNLKTGCPDEARKESVSCDNIEVSPRKLFNEFCIKKEPCESESSIGLHLGLSVGSFLSVDNLNGGTNDQMHEDMLQNENPPEDKDDNMEIDVCKDAVNMIDDNMEIDVCKDAVNMIGMKRKQTECSDDVPMSAHYERTKAKSEDHVSVKKIRGERKVQTVPTTDQADVTVSDGSQQCTSDRVVSSVDKRKHDLKEEVADIMSIVQGAGCKLSKGLACQKLADKSSKERENAAGLRVKKIMKRAPEDKDSFIVVQKLRKEIRDAIRNKSSKEIGENLFDPELLAAFRAAVTGPKTEPVKKLSPMAMKLKKSILQKGKVRENLTKKIYANSSGRRKRAWDRDCEVEFWKHRCMRYTKPEKIETLNSVLNLLRKSSESPEMEQGSECSTTNPILSRLYLADTSVFPRKDDIKPLSVLKGSGSEENAEIIPGKKGSRPSLCNRTAEITETPGLSLKVGIPLSDDKGSKGNFPSSEGDSTRSKLHPKRRPEGLPNSPLGSLKAKVQKEVSDKPEDKKIDKRKWALEVLARKNSAAGKNGSNEKQEDNANLKGNYPLLAQLPADMRPELAPCRHNKIPISVRQTQLYRLTEFFLKKANLPIIRRTADTELAVADAINIEKEVANRSNSKLVYMNLCSQELLHRSDNSKSNRVTESDPSTSSGVTNNEPEQEVDELSTDPMVAEALQAAGLLFDSPPNSPLHQTEVPKEEDLSMKNTEEGPDNVFEMDSHPELDIYGDFEYSLEDEDYIGSSAIGLSKPQPSEVVPKLKVIFSTLDSEKLNESVDSKDCEKLKTLEVPKDSSCLLECQTVEDINSSTMENGSNKICAPLETSLAEEGEELSIAECEELYGPDKEPLIKIIPEASTELHGLSSAGAELKDPSGKENYESKQAMNASELESEIHAKNILATIGHNSCGENSPKNSQSGGNVQGKEKKSNIGTNNQSDDSNSISKKVEAYIKEHIRPLCKSGVITAEQYRWAVSKTTEKVMKHHSKAKNAHFLIKEGERVKKLAEQYVEASAQQK